MTKLSFTETIFKVEFYLPYEVKFRLKKKKKIRKVLCSGSPILLSDTKIIIKLLRASWGNKVTPDRILINILNDLFFGLNKNFLLDFLSGYWKLLIHIL